MIQKKAIQFYLNRFPGSHVGGSLGLALRGIDLGRDLSTSDIDLTIPYDIKHLLSENELSYSEASCPETMDYVIDFGEGIKVDIQINPNWDYDRIVGADKFIYRVTDQRITLGYKYRYAIKDKSDKHIKDIAFILSGQRDLIDKASVAVVTHQHKNSLSL